MVLTRLAVVLATSLADWTNCLLATGLEVLEEARRQALQRAEVCLATIVAADKTWQTNKCQEIVERVVVNEALWCGVSELFKAFGSILTFSNLMGHLIKVAWDLYAQLFHSCNPHMPGNGHVMFFKWESLTCDGLLAGSTKFWQAIWIAWWALANWTGSTSPSWPDWLLGSDTPTR